MTLLLGPPSSGKTSLLLALAGKLDRDLRVCSHFSVYFNYISSLYHVYFCLIRSEFYVEMFSGVWENHLLWARAK